MSSHVRFRPVSLTSVRICRSICPSMCRSICPSIPEEMSSHVGLRSVSLPSGGICRSIRPHMPKHVSQNSGGGALRLWKRMLEATGYPDPGVVDEMSHGTDLVGEVSLTGMFRTHGLRFSKVAWGVQLPGRRVPRLMASCHRSRTWC